MQINPRDRILELDCGEAEMSLALAARAPEGLVVAMDPSDDRVRRARARHRDLDNLMFLQGRAGEIPWKEDFFSKALSHGLPADVADVLRMLVPGGLFYLAPGSDEGSESGSVEDWVGRLEAAGFGAIEAHLLPGNQTALVGRKAA